MQYHKATASVKLCAFPCPANTTSFASLEIRTVPSDQAHLRKNMSEQVRAKDVSVITLYSFLPPSS